MKCLLRNAVLGATFGVAFTLAAFPADAESAASAGQLKYPTKPVTMIVPFSAGGATDSLARLVGQKLTEKWGQTFIIENRPGAGGNIGAAAGARAQPDGYTLTFTAAGIAAVNPHLYKDLSYDSIESFAPVTQLVSAPLLLAVHPSLGITTFDAWLSAVKAKPGVHSVANGGLGTAQHLGAKYLDMQAGVESLHVPYKGSAPATADVLGGQTEAILDNMVTLIPHIRTKKLVPLAVASMQRVAVLPDVPTMDESGLKGFEAGTWYGVVAPAGTPQQIIDKLQSEIAKILADPEVRKSLQDQGLEPVASTPQEFAKRIRADRQRMGEIVKAADIRLD